MKKIQLIFRIILAIIFSATIWIRVDWSVGVLAMLFFIQSELINKLLKVVLKD